MGSRKLDSGYFYGPFVYFVWNIGDIFVTGTESYEEIPNLGMYVQNKVENLLIMTDLN